MLSDKTKKIQFLWLLHKNLIGFTFFPWSVSVSSLLFPPTCHAHWAFIQTTLSAWIDVPSPEKLSGRQAWDQIPLPSTSHIQVFIPNWLLTSEKPQQITHFSNYSLTDSLLFPLKAEFCLYGLRQVLYLQSPTAASWLLGLDTCQHT